MERNKQVEKNYNQVLVLLVFSCLFLCCKSVNRPVAFADRETLVAYINDPENGLTKEVSQSGGLKIRMTSLSPILLPGYEEAKKDSLSNRLYLILSLSFKERELLAQLPREQYSAMLQLFAFGMNDKLRALIDDQLTVEPLLVHFQPSYNLSGSNDLLLVFDKSQVQQGKRIEIIVDEFGLQTGRLRFDFNIEDFEYLESLHILNES